jgi:uncharacterized protein
VSRLGTRNTRKKQFRVINKTKNATLAEASRKTQTPVGRALGLMGRKGLPDGAGLIIEPCNSVVSFFMRFPIDVLFVNADGKVLHIKENMVPWRTSKIVRGSKLVIELPAGRVRNTQTQVADFIAIEGP